MDLEQPSRGWASFWGVLEVKVRGAADPSSQAEIWHRHRFGLRLWVAKEMIQIHWIEKWCRFSGSKKVPRWLKHTWNPKKARSQDIHETSGSCNAPLAVYEKMLSNIGIPDLRWFQPLSRQWQGHKGPDLSKCISNLDRIGLGREHHARLARACIPPAGGARNSWPPAQSHRWEQPV